MLDLCDVLTVSTPQMAEALSPRRSVVIDDAVEFEVPGPLAEGWRDLRAQGRRRRTSRLRLAWFGSAGTARPQFGLRDLADWVPTLNEVNETIPIELTCITNSRPLFRATTSAANFPTHYRRWRRATFARVLRRSDLCLLPISLNPFTVCKTSNRVVTSLVLGLPVIADRIPSYDEFAPAIAFGATEEHFESYCDLVAARNAVARGREIVASRFTPQHLVSQWQGAVLQAVG
jgi:hypothetical protein